MMQFIYTLTPLRYFIDPLSRDEAFSFILAHKNILDIIFYTAHSHELPLYYGILHFWMVIFGTSEIAIRTVSLLFYWGTMYLLFDSMLDMFEFGYKKAAAYLFLFMVNPILAYYAFVAGPYIQAAFFAALAFYAFHTGRKRLHLAALILGIYTHYFMLFIWILQYVFIYRNHRKGHKHNIEKKSFHIALVAFIPWCVYILTQNVFSGFVFKFDKIHVTDLFNLPAILYTGTGLGKNFLIPTILLSLIIITILLIGFLKKTSEIYDRLLLWSLGAPLIIFGISLFKPAFHPGYLLFTVPGLLLAITYSIESMKPKAKYLFLSLLVVSTLTHLGLQIAYRNRGSEAIAASLKEIAVLASDNDVVYVDRASDYFISSYYFEENRTFISGDTYQEIPDYIGNMLISKEKFTTQLPYYPMKAYILKKDGSYEISAAY